MIVIIVIVIIGIILFNTIKPGKPTEELPDKFTIPYIAGIADQEVISYSRNKGKYWKHTSGGISGTTYNKQIDISMYWKAYKEYLKAKVLKK